VIWFTLGNISVVGTYSTTVHNLTPRGLVFLAAAIPAAAAAAVAATIPYILEERAAYSCGGISPLAETAGSYVIYSQRY
jgi:hypothetical protein